MRAVRFYVLRFIFRNRGPLQKVCRDADTPAQLVMISDCMQASRYAFYTWGMYLTVTVTCTTVTVTVTEDLF
jgi:hypothetical protein